MPQTNQIRVKKSEQVVVFGIDAQRYALPANEVAHVFRAVAVTPLPNAPGIVMGVINVQGDVLPAVDIRKRLRVKEREPALGDHMVVTASGKRRVVFFADRVEGTEEITDEDVATAENIHPGLDSISGVIKKSNGLLFIYDPAKFFSPEEEQVLALALKHATAQ